MQVTLKNVRMSFSDLFVAKSPKDYPNSPPKYSVTLLIKKGSEQDKAIQAAIKTEAEARWLGKAAAKLDALKGDKRSYCYRDGDLEEREGYEGHMVLVSKSSARPKVIDRDKTDLTQDDNRLYSGCYVVAVIDIYAQAKPNEGIRSGLKGVQFFNDGSGLGGATPAKDSDFDDLSVEDEDAPLV